MGKLTNLGFALLLKRKGIKQDSSKYFYSHEKRQLVLRSAYTALEEDVALFSDSELFEIISELKKTVDKAYSLLERAEDGIEGCTYGDTKYDSQSVYFGYKMALEDILSL